MTNLQGPKGRPSDGSGTILITPPKLPCIPHTSSAGCVNAFVPLHSFPSDTSPLICLLDTLLDHDRHPPLPFRRPTSRRCHRIKSAFTASRARLDLSARAPCLEFKALFRLQ